MREKRVLALIPARGGSKGIPGKNIKKMAGKPLIAYSIEAALGCREIDRVIVSTDSEEIARAAIQYGAEVPFLRPAHLATDTAKTIDAVLYTLDKLRQEGDAYDWLVLLQPTSPLRTTEDISGAIRLALESASDVVAVSEVRDSPILIRRCGSDGMLSPLLEQGSTVRRQDMPMYYRINGSVYVNQICNLNEQTSFNDNPMGYIMPKSRGIDIDEPEDFMMSEYFLTNRG